MAAGTENKNFSVILQIFFFLFFYISQKTKQKITEKILFFTVQLPENFFTLYFYQLGQAP